MNWDTLITELTIAILPVLFIIAGYVLIIIARYIRTRTDNQIVSFALTNLEQIIFSTVTALSQTLVDDLKGSRASGKLTAEEADLIKNKAISSVHKQLSTKDREILTEYFGSVEELIDNIIEQKVAENKLRKGDI
jgi:hypothetical protein